MESHTLVPGNTEGSQAISRLNTVLTMKKYLLSFIALLLPWLNPLATAAVVDAIYNSAADVPVTAASYTATGNTVNFALNFTPAAGTDVFVIKNTGLNFIDGTFENLTNGQLVTVNFSGTNFVFVANYFGGSGNDLVLMWASSRIYAWGYNNFGQIGDGTSGTNRLVPVPVDTKGVLAGKIVTAIASSLSTSLALCADGSIAAWGRNNVGQLGNNTTNDSSEPVLVDSGVDSALYGKTVIAIAASKYHGLALCSDGTVAAWGYNHTGAIGDATLNNRLIPVAANTTTNSALNGKTVIAIAAGDDGDSRNHSLALCSDGTVAFWGFRWPDGINNPLPKTVTAASGSALFGKSVIAIAAGGLHDLALCSDGTIAAWGGNIFGQLGNNSTTDSAIPVAVVTNATTPLYGKKTVSIAAGVFHNLALCSDGTLAGWGYNSQGQIGDNSKVNRLVPVAVNTTSGLSALNGKTVSAIAGGLYHSEAICSDGTIAAWGYNFHGQLGVNSTNTSLIPTNVNAGFTAGGRQFGRIGRSTSSNHNLALVAGPAALATSLLFAQKNLDGSFQFDFTNTPGAFFTVLAATNLAAQSTVWTSLSGVAELSPGQFFFNDPSAANNSQCFYRIQSP